MSDLKERLLAQADLHGIHGDLEREAVQEIERLEAVVDAADAIEHLVITHTQDEQADYVKFQESLAALIGESDES